MQAHPRGRWLDVQNVPLSGWLHNSIKCSPQEYGKCDNYCYIIDGENKLVLREGREYRNPARPCIVYRCTVSIAGLFQARI